MTDLCRMRLGILAKWLSYLIPIHVDSYNGEFGELEVRWEQGHKVLNSVNGNQSFGSLHQVWQGTLKKILSRTHPSSVLMLGFGGGSAAWILRNELNCMAPITAIELDPTMITIADQHFGAADLEHVKIIKGNAIIQVQAMNERHDLVLVDLFNDLDMAQGIDTSGFAHALRNVCSQDGTVCFNTVGYDDHSDARCTKILGNLARVFNSTEELNFEGINRVFIAF